MHLDTENMYLSVHYNMPPVCLWDRRSAVLKWFKHKSHCRPKGKEQAYFYGVFPEATDADAKKSVDNAYKLKQKMF